MLRVALGFKYNCKNLICKGKKNNLGFIKI